jgi:hypothetical protein
MKCVNAPSVSGLPTGMAAADGWRNTAGKSATKNAVVKTGGADFSLRGEFSPRWLCGG